MNFNTCSRCDNSECAPHQSCVRSEETHAAERAVVFMKTSAMGKTTSIIDYKAEYHRLHALVNNPQTAEFLDAVKAEAAHQRERWGEAHDRGKSAENWFWLVGYLAGKCLRAVIIGDKEKALHHTISAGAALANWYEAIKRDETGCGMGHDNDIKPVELARFEDGKGGA